MTARKNRKKIAGSTFSLICCMCGVKPVAAVAAEAACAVYLSPFLSLFRSIFTSSYLHPDPNISFLFIFLDVRYLLFSWSEQ